jgi:hypothetical protein
MTATEVAINPVDANTEEARRRRTVVHVDLAKNAREASGALTLGGVESIHTSATVDAHNPNAIVNIRFTRGSRERAWTDAGPRQIAVET